MAATTEEGIDWDAFVRHDGPKLHRYFCARFTASEAADLVQDVLIRIYRKQEDYDPKKGPLIAYALGVAHFVARESLRKRSRLRLADDPAPSIERPSLDGTPEDYLQEEQAAQRVRAAIGRLPEAEQEILALLVERELSLQDIAAIVEKPLGTVKSHIHRAKLKLREMLQENPPRTVAREDYAGKGETT